jgi:N-glycosylase/DNA lyase
MRIQLDQAKTPFSLDHTLSCGQTFRWEKHGERWTGVVSQTVLKIRQTESGLEFNPSKDGSASEFVRRYFRLNDDLPLVYSRIGKDRYVSEAVRRFRGLRLIRQEPWECLISYICATNKNIPAIKRMIFNLCSLFGEPIDFEGEEFHAFPKPDVLARAKLSELRRCKLGYRAENVLKTSKLVSRGDFDLQALETMIYEDAKKRLLTLPGVGPKVADCVLLFSLNKPEALPLDVWMKRIILQYYSRHFEPEFVTKIKEKKGLSLREYQVMYDFGRSYFGEFLGYAQEYLYHYNRCEANPRLEK